MVDDKGVSGSSRPAESSADGERILRSIFRTESVDSELDGVSAMLRMPWLSLSPGCPQLKDWEFKLV